MPDPHKTLTTIIMRAIILHQSSAVYKTDRDLPQLTSLHNVLVKVYYAGICRTDIGIGKGIVPAKEHIVMGHEFCGRIAGFLNGESTMDGWSVGDVVSANPMAFGTTADTMCGKDCDGAFAEYIAVPSAALVHLPSQLLSPLGAFLEPVAAALAPLKYITGRTCIFGASRIAELTHQVARAMGHHDIERIAQTDDLRKNSYDCIIETEPSLIDAYIDALLPGGMLVLKSRSYMPCAFTANTIAMKEVGIRGARYGDFNVASHLLTATAHHLPDALDTSTLFGNTYDLSQFEEAFAEAERMGSKKTFFKICAE